MESSTAQDQQAGSTVPPESGGLDSGDEVVSAHDELDLTGEGFSVPRTNWEIVSAEVEAPNPGQQRAVIEFRATYDGIEYGVTERFWLQYTGSGDPSKDQQTTNIGRGQLKRLFKAAFGTPKGTVAGLVGQWVSAEGSEDNAGFRRLQGFREAERSEGDTGGL